MQPAGEHSLVPERGAQAAGQATPRFGPFEELGGVGGFAVLRGVQPFALFLFGDA
jgi:hypothetical protein